jgi:hypothetical protein
VPRLYYVIFGNVSNHLAHARSGVATNSGHGDVSQESGVDSASGSESDFPDLSDSNASGCSRSECSLTEASRDDDQHSEDWHSAAEEVDSVEEEYADSIEQYFYCSDAMELKKLYQRTISRLSDVLISIYLHDQRPHSWRVLDC